MSSNNDMDGGNLKDLLALEPARHKGRYFKHLLVWPVLLLAAILIYYIWSGTQEGPLVTYRTAEARQGDLVVMVTATGNLEPTNQVDVGSEVSGTIEAVEVDYNDVVRAGQVLTRLDTTMLAAQVNQSQSAVASARANLLQAEASLLEATGTLERFSHVRSLSQGKIPSQQDFEAAEASLARARANEAMAMANIAQAEARLRIDQTNLEKAIIHSPINGVVLVRSVEKGQTVAASLQSPVLFTLAEDLTQMELHVAVDEADVGMVREGQPATFTVDAYPDRVFPARITQVRYGAQTTDGVVTYRTVLNVDNGDLSLRPGMTATADIVVKELHDALLVPNSALRYAPPVQEEKAAQQSNGSLLSKLFPRPSRTRPRSGEDSRDRAQQRVWTLRNNQPVAVAIITGATSGVMTEVVKGEVTPGMPLIIESVGKGR